MKQSQVILITGASSGFGKITAQTLAAQGHIVYGTSRKQTENKGNVTMLIADVTDNSSIHCVVEHIMQERGRIDVLINNAGMGIGGALELATDKEIALQMDTNFLGMVRVCRSVLPIMRRQRKGKKLFRWKYIHLVSKYAWWNREILIQDLQPTGISLPPP